MLLYTPNKETNLQVKMLQGCQLTVGLRNGHHAPQLKIEKVNQAPVKRNSDTEQQSSVFPFITAVQNRPLWLESPVGWQKRIFLPSIMHQSLSDFINVFWWKSVLNHVG